MLLSLVADWFSGHVSGEFEVRYLKYRKMVRYICVEKTTVKSLSKLFGKILSVGIICWY